MDVALEFERCMNIFPEISSGTTSLRMWFFFLSNYRLLAQVMGYHTWGGSTNDYGSLRGPELKLPFGLPLQAKNLFFKPRFEMSKFIENERTSLTKHAGDNMFKVCLKEHLLPFNILIFVYGTFFLLNGPSQASRFNEHTNKSQFSKVFYQGGEIMLICKR